MLIAVITARGGSKRLPGKNSRPLLGTSLVERSVNIAEKAKIFSRIIVSTDDKKIAKLAKNSGAEVPFLRPAELASDNSSSVEVLYHLVNQLALDLHGLTICLLQPTSPLLRSEQIRQGYDKFIAGNFTSLSAMTKVSQHPEWRFKECQDSGKVAPVDLKGFNSGKTELYLIENGAFYFVNGDWLVKEQSLYNFANHGFYLMSIADSIDIDTEEDWQMAEAMLRYRQS